LNIARLPLKRMIRDIVALIESSVSRLVATRPLYLTKSSISSPKADVASGF